MKRPGGILDLNQPAEVCAPALLGCYIERQLGGQRLVGRIVETEAYDQEDAASHSYRGQTPRTEVMFGPPGRAYVYFTYGMHHCFNIVVGPQGRGSAVLVRALEPISGLPAMRANRPGVDDSQLTNGPAKLCYALSIDRRLNGHDLSRPPLLFRLNEDLPAEPVVQAKRIGISRDTHRRWRWYLKGNPYVSKT